MAKSKSSKWWGAGIVAGVFAALGGGVFLARKYNVAEPGTWSPIFADSPDAVALAGKPDESDTGDGVLVAGDAVEIVIVAKGSNDVALVRCIVVAPTTTSSGAALVVEYDSAIKQSNKAQPLPKDDERFTIFEQNIHAIRRKK